MEEVAVMVPSAIGKEKLNLHVADTDEVAVMVPSTVNNDELSDEAESINLDLHVSDTEDSTECLKKCDTEIKERKESEDDILNKYIDDEDAKEVKNSSIELPLPNGVLETQTNNIYEKCNGNIEDEVDEGGENLEEALVTERDDEPANVDDEGGENLEETLETERDDEPVNVDDEDGENLEEALVTERDDEPMNVDNEGGENLEEALGTERGDDPDIVDESGENLEEALVSERDDEPANEVTLNGEKDDKPLSNEVLNGKKDDETTEKDLLKEENDEEPMVETVLNGKNDDDTTNEAILDEKDDENINESLLKDEDEEDILENTTKDEEKLEVDTEIEEAKVDKCKTVLSEESTVQTDNTLTNRDDNEKESSDKTIGSDSEKTIDSDSVKETKAKEIENFAEKLDTMECGDNSDKTDTLPDSNEQITDKKDNEAKTEDLEDNDDLLCVMDEKTEEETEDMTENNKDENSCSSSDKDYEPKESEENTETEEAKDDEEMEENGETQMDLDVDVGECAMDIEESDIGGVVYAAQNRDSSNSETNDSESKLDSDKDANKENENNDSVAKLADISVAVDEVVENGLTNGEVEVEVNENNVVTGTNEEEDTQKKSSKRQLSDASIEGDSAKKIKLQSEEVEKPPEKRPIYLLESFKNFMLDKKLKTLTRFELEELCMQKMCECIVNKSEIGELRQKIMMQEEKIEKWRTDAQIVSKQTRDLKIVHERLIADLKQMKEQTGKPLVPVKITRSVGLQAIIENPARVRPAPIVTAPTPQQRPAVIVNSTNNQQNKNATTPAQNRPPVKPKPSPQRPQNNNNSRPLQPITQKDNVNNAKPRQTVSSPQQNKKNADPKAVIDLTDEDEKNQNAKQTTNTASPTVRILNKQNVNVNSNKPATTTPTSQPSKIMFVTPGVLPRNSAVMVKMNSNGLVSPQNGLTTIPNGQVSTTTTPVVRTVSQVRVPVSSFTTVRTPTPTKQVFKHPAPLPAAPSYQNSLAVGKKPIPPKPHLNLTRSSCGTGIVLQWKMPYKLDTYETIVSYQLYAYQETKSPPKTDNWGKIGDVKALELPMAVTLTQFAVGNRYFFAVRAVDGQKRFGPFSEPENILL